MKLKTIEEILLLNVEFGAKNKKVWVSKIVPQIKQLIADEVIDLVTEFELDRYESGGKMFYAVSDVVSMARKRSKEQLKKLERL